MNKLDETTLRKLIDENIDEVKAYIEEREEDFQAGDIVWRWDHSHERKKLGVYEGKNEDNEHPYVVGSEFWKNVAHPHGVPNIRIRWTKDKRPPNINDDDIVLIEYLDGNLRKGRAGIYTWENTVAYTLIEKGE